MPKYTFTDAEAQNTELLPPGEYIAEVIDASQTISKGKNTAGSDQLELKLREQNTGSVFYETLIFHPTVAWKIDCFIKSMGIHAVKGQEVDLEITSVIGLRGWCILFRDEYNGVKRNKVRVWVTNKEKLPRNVPLPVQPTTPDDPFAEDDNVVF